jgi:hypothetical protein
MKLRDLQAWDCFGVHVTVTVFPYLAEMSVRVRFPRIRRELAGHYLLTLDWHANGYSDAPDERKDLHLIRLDNGCLAAQPNDRLLWHEESFAKPTGWPDYRRQTRVWWAEP